MAPLKIVGFLPREAGEGIMLPYDITTLSGSDFDVDKLYIMRKEFMVNENKVNMHKILFDEIENSQAKPLKGEAKSAVRELISQFLDNPFNKEILLSQSVAKDYIKLTEKAYNKMLDLYLKNKIIVTPYTSGRGYRNNKIVDMTYEVLTHETSADKVLNPGGFDPQKKMGYMVSVYRNSNKYTWEQLEAMSINDLRDLSNTDKNLAFIDIHVQFYKQNAAAGSLIGIFAVHRTAHAVLESTTEDGSSKYFVDITNACKTKQPFNIMGMEFRGNMPFDMRYDRNGQLIGKVLGSLVASSADAVKDPVLNLMNINGNTANILTTLIRMGMPFEDAALFISQSAISDILDMHSKENITRRKSLNRIIKDKIAKLKEEHSISDHSEINSEELTREELLKGLKPGVDPKTEYKVLLAFSNLSKISQALRMPTFATRFNTVSNAAGPLIIDNLTIEYTMEDLSTSSSIVDKKGNSVTITDIFDEHPILKEFAEGIHIAKEILGNVPTNSRGFRNVLETLKENNTLNSILRDRKLFGYLSDFYQSYLLMSNNVVNEKDLKYYISEFPKEFKNSKFKEKYQDNLLIQAIKYGTDKNNRLTLNIDTTGLDTQAKERLLSAWIDLHKVDPELSIKLFKYNFFKGGIGYNPKTFMNLLPIYVKEQIPGYIDTFRLLPATSPWLVVNQFMRNNWNNDDLVPTIKTVSFTGLHNGNLLINKKSEIDSLYGASFFKVNFKDKTGDNYKLFEVIYRDPEGKYVECKETTPLGNNKDYLEISSDVINPMEISSEVLKDIEEELKGDELNNLSTENFIDDTTENNESSEIESLLYDVLVIEGVRTKEQADDIRAEYRELPPAEKSRREDKMKKFFENRLNKLGIEVNEDLTDKLYNELCK